MKSYFENHNVNVSKEYIESLISNNNINTIRKDLRRQYGPLQLRGDLVVNNTYEVRLLCPTFCHSQSIKQMKKNNNIFILKNKKKYELIIYNYGNTRKTINKSIPSYNLILKKASDFKNPYQDKFAYLKNVLDNIFTQFESSCLYANDQTIQYENMTHLQLGLIEKRMPICMNFEQTVKFLPFFKIIIEMTKHKSGKLSTIDIETFEKGNFEKGDILNKSIFLHDNYNHIVGVICEGYIIPILPSSYDYNDVLLKNINMICYYDIKSSELKNAKDMIAFLENIFLVLKLYNKTPDTALIRKLCTPIAYKPKVCITPNSDNRIESLITYTNQVVKCSNTLIKKGERETVYSKYELMRASFFEIEKNLNHTMTSHKSRFRFANSIELFETNHTSLSRLGYYYNRHNKKSEVIHSITIEYKNHLDKEVTLHLFFNREVPLNNFADAFLSKIKPHIREVEQSKLKSEAGNKGGFNFEEMYELLIFLWNKSNRRLSLKPIDYYMTERDLNGDKKVSGFYLENNMMVLFKNKVLLTDISKQKINLRKTFNPFETIKLNEINNDNSNNPMPITIQKLHNKTVLYELFIRELSRAIQMIDKQGYTKNPKSIPYEIGNIVWINEDGWKIGIIKNRDLKNHLLYDVEYKNAKGNPIMKKQVDVNELYVSFKVAIYNILNKQIVNIFAKLKALYELFQVSSGVIIIA